ncbi:alpha/beta hydrolase [Cupriavidus cauae]|uniref:Dienelactone hydrolase n=1 Tax=Cupriavidus cauae TaxID=2608999 RepID=A0A5M8AW45_9BURK|nr:dienelactone hydrolase family protein [Cupriavidus cauae]KAA6127002.1 dienelactone hydrolase [Cupriavidus cauae]
MLRRCRAPGAHDARDAARDVRRSVPFARLALCLLAWAALPAGAAPLEETWSVPVTVTDAHGRQVSQRIVVTAFREPGHQRYPLLVLNHGRAPDPYARARLGRVRLAEQAAYFASLGFQVLVPTRIGYGASGGDDIENTGSCTRKNYRPGFEVAAQQVLQVIEMARSRPEIDVSRVVLVGQSFGGAAVIALAAKNPPGVRLVLNFAGGGGGDPRLHPGEPCAPDQQAALFAEYGRSARVPTHWIYTTNDRYMGPYPAQWFEAFRGAGGVGKYHALPAFGQDGHQLFARGLTRWKPLAENALRDAGFEPRPLNRPAAASAVRPNDVRPNGVRPIEGRPIDGRPNDARR